MSSATTKGKKAVEKKNAVLEKLNVEYVAIDSLQPNSYNPNRQSQQDFDLLVRSMQEDGFTQPIVALKATRKIVDGEHRWRAAGHLGHTEIPVVFVDMTEEQARIATLRHNRARGSEDMELAAEVLRDLERLGALDWAADSLMLDDVELQRLLEDVPAPEALAGEEFGEAWDPLKSSEAQNYTTASVKETVQGAGGTEMMTASTPTALNAMREREQRLQEAQTTAERQQITREMRSFWRVSFLFDGEDAALVKAVLGQSESPAEAVVGLVKHAIATGHVKDPRGGQVADAVLDADTGQLS